MRKDAIGFFWEDLPLEPRVPKEPVRCIPPEPTWLDVIPEVDPNNYQLTSIPVLVNQSEVALDIEVYQNYFLCCMMGVDDGKVYYLEATEDDPFTKEKAGILLFVLLNATTIGFNSLKYDLPLCELAIKQHSTYRIKDASDDIILRNQRMYCRRVYNHIDLIEIAPLRASLKTYAGRLHTSKMQDLPFHPDTYLTPEQIEVTRHYCVNDLRNTILLAGCLREQIELRYTISNQYRVDVRSKSDAQIAETIISLEMKRALNAQVMIPPIEAGKSFYFHPPSYIQFETPALQEIFTHVARTRFNVDFLGDIKSELGSPTVQIGDNSYSLGVGGLHSSEQSIMHSFNDEYIIVDIDVTSYYPFITLNTGLYPKQMGPKYLNVLRKIVNQRVDAKRSGNKTMADSFKIVVNGAFGKYGSPHSILYAPELLIQVTITGQLSLLMLIEALELRGIKIISANTDGMTAYLRRTDKPRFDAIVEAWEQLTGFETEETPYRALFSRDVNNYIALKQDKTFKTKGAYASPPLGSPEALHKNPVTLICIEAVKEYLLTGKDVFETIYECKDIRQFVVVRNVKGGAVQLHPDVQYIGKVARWYYSTTAPDSLVYANSGRKVPKSLGAKPLMELPASFPDDVDIDWYVREAERILKDIGVTDATSG
jgi:hypothetical protein